MSRLPPMDLKNHSIIHKPSHLFNLNTIFLIFLLLISYLDHVVSRVIEGYNRTYCEYITTNYSLEWGYEPQTRHIIFVLKTKISKIELYKNHGILWSGVGFSDSNENQVRQFAGIQMKGNEFEVRWLNAIQNGSLSGENSTSAGMFRIDVNYDTQNEKLVAKFSRQIRFDDSSFYDIQLDGCMKFYMPLKAHNDSEIRSLKLETLVKPFKVCDIEKKCTVNVPEIDSKKLEVIKSIKLEAPKKLKDSRVSKDDEEDLKTKKIRKHPKDVEVAHSVDISGTGDPCGYAGIGYVVNWTYNTKSECIDFVMRHPAKPGKWWSAVGIGDTMADMDIGVFFLENGTPKKIIDYFSSSYSVPEKDKQQDWILHNSKSKVIEELFGESTRKQNVAVTYFSRRLNTGDNEKDRTLEGCVLFQLAANAAKYGGNYGLRKHEDWPDLYKACDIKTKCADSYSNHDDHIATAHSIDSENMAVPMKIIPNAKHTSKIIVNVGANENSMITIEKSPTNTIINNFTEKIVVEDIKNNMTLSGEEQKAATILLGDIKNSTIPQSEIISDDEKELSLNATIIDETVVSNNGSVIESQRAPAVITLIGEFVTPEIDTDLSSTTAVAESIKTITNTTINYRNEINIAISSKANNPTTQTTTTETSKNERSITYVTALLNKTITEKLNTKKNTISNIVLAVNESTSDDTSQSLKPIITTNETKTTILFTTTTATTEKNELTTKKIEFIVNSSSISTSKTKNEELSSTTETISIRPSKIKAKTSKRCDSDKEDLEVCLEYMGNYFAQVKKWAYKHNERMENQYGKACRLLNAIPNVPTLCCHVFNDKCNEHI